jgi:A/G-specific adenine glycosylase
MAARRVVNEHSGRFPSGYEQIKALPGIGPATAGAIMAYAYNQPVIFIETNVRTVYFHHFFKDHTDINDSQLRPLIEQTLDGEHPREFYGALMDYGTWLKRSTATGLNGQSRHYKKQTKFEGSVREVRGQIIRLLAESEMTLPELQKQLKTDERFTPAFEGLLKDELIGRTGAMVYLTK